MIKREDYAKAIVVTITVVWATMFLIKPLI